MGSGSLRQDRLPAKWDFRKIRGTLFWGPYNRILLLGYYIGVPIFGNPQMRLELAVRLLQASGKAKVTSPEVPGVQGWA